MNQKNQNKPMGQLLTQRRFYLANQFLYPLASIIKEGFGQRVRQAKKRLTARNLAMAHAIRYAIKGEYPDLFVDPALVLLSDGPVRGITVDHITRDTAMLQVDFDGGEITTINHDDEVLLLAYDQKGQVAVRNEKPVIRSASAMVLKLPDYMQEVKLDLYVLLRDRDGIRYSRSQYLGSV